MNNWAILRDWHGGVLTKLVISYPILELASIFWYHWMCNIQEGTIHMLTYSYTERNQPQRIKIRATPTFLVCLSPQVKCTQHPVWCRSLTFMLCSLYPVYLGWTRNKWLYKPGLSGAGSIAPLFHSSCTDCFRDNHFRDPLG